MKNVKSMLLTLVVLLGISAQASEKGLIEVNNHVNPKYTVISVINNDYSFDNIEIQCNNTGKTLMSESIKEEVSYQKLINLKNVSNGRYTVSLSGNTESIVKEYDVLNGKLFNRESAQDIYEDTKQTRFFMDENNKNLTVSHINADKEQLIFVVTNLENQKNIEYIEEGRQLGYSNIYNTEYLRKGTYRATLISGDIFYHYDFEVIR